MTQTKQRRSHGATIKVLALAISAFGSTASHAAAFQLLEGNASGLGNAYAGSAAVAEDASTVFFNPAGMTLLPGRNVAFSVDLVRPSAKFDNQGSTVPPGQGIGGNGGDAGDWAAIPAGYMTWQLTDRLFAGLGVGAPFGLKTEYGADWVGRFHAVKSEIKTVNINPSIAFKVNDVLSIGIGVNFQRIDADLTNLVTNPGLAGSLASGRIKGDDTAWGWNAGLMWQVSDTTRLGAAYRSKMDYKLEGTARFTGLNPSGNIVATALNAGRGGDVTADVELPDTATFSVAQKISDRWTMLGDISWTGWSTLQDLTVNRVDGVNVTTEELRWRDTWRVAFGGTYAYTDALSLKFGLAWDQTPVRDTTRLPRVPDEDRVWLSLGLQWRPNATSAVDVGYAHLFVKDAKVNNDGGSALLKGTLVGEYENSVDILGVQYSTRF
ncbi:MAG: outer membrane protein transport protein [Methyloversatilis discipulorum]|jgi:long-chain fatty acid transport protein|uniref:OmpP1/FadL family transporter n=1 Tax=Methyloversatilis discipulorum TaxID=1119528 RepID=UPI0026EE8A7C|nr:outer membrane protein transport protein [Methyloversatilis discipulorum]MBV5287907.1 outer membrane protein transport protein [Methyloversatilis discipulorum]